MGNKFYDDKGIYEIVVEEKLQRVIKVNATNEQEAIDKVQAMYDNEEIILDADDFVEVQFY